MLPQASPHDDARAKAEALLAPSEQCSLYPVSPADRAAIIDALTEDFRVIADLAMLKQAQREQIAAQTQRLSELVAALTAAIATEQS